MLIRMQVLKSVIGGITGFWIQMFVFPKGVISKIDSMCKRFLWNGNGSGKKFSVAWKYVTLPYAEGGLGIKEILGWNKTIRFKLAADLILKRKGMWLSWAIHNLIRERGMLNLECKINDSWLWKSIVRTITEFTSKTQAVGELDLSGVMDIRGKVSCRMIYDVFRSRHDVVPWVSFFGKGYSAKMVCHHLAC